MIIIPPTYNILDSYITLHHQLLTFWINLYVIHIQDIACKQLGNDYLISRRGWPIFQNKLFLAWARKKENKFVSGILWVHTNNGGRKVVSTNMNKIAYMAIILQKSNCCSLTIDLYIKFGCTVYSESRNINYLQSNWKGIVPCFLLPPFITNIFTLANVPHVYYMIVWYIQYMYVASRLLHM